MASAMRAKHAAANFSGKRAVVVGGTSGIGHGIAVRLASANFNVTIVGRNRANGSAVVDAMKAASSPSNHCHHEFVELDVQLLANARAFAASYSSRHPSLDVLVLSQGIATIQGRSETSEGIDQKLSLHYYGRMAFIQALLPSLRAAPAAKVLSILSAGIHSPYLHYADDPELKMHYTLKNAANASGFYNNLCLDAFSREAANNKITFIHAFPGFVNTPWGKELPWWIRGFIRAIQPMGRSKEDCAEFMCDSIFNDTDKGGFKMIGADAQIVKPSAGHTPVARDSLWTHTQEVFTRIDSKFGFAPSASESSASAAATSPPTAPPPASVS